MGTDFKSVPMASVESGAGNEIRTRDPNLGKVVLYQLSYSRVNRDGYCRDVCRAVNSLESSGFFRCRQARPGGFQVDYHGPERQHGGGVQ